MSLTDAAVRAAGPRVVDGVAKNNKVFDGQVPGLFLYVKSDGKKYWRMAYRFARRPNVYSCGVYPAVSLKEARSKALAARALLADGVDPNRHKRALQASRYGTGQDTFAVVAEEWYSKGLTAWAPSTAKKVRERLDNDLLPYLGRSQIGDLRTFELLGVLNRVADRGAIDVAHKCRQMLNQICRYAKQTGRSEHNPAADLVGALPARKTEHHAAIIEPQRFGRLLIDIDDCSGSHTLRTAMALAPLLFQRPGELVSMEWTHLDLDGGYWNIPKDQKKERRTRVSDHLVPLPRQAIELIRDLQPLTGHRQYVFTNQRNPAKHMTTEAINQALRRIGYCTRTEQCFHGFRASARTMLDEQLGFRIEWIEQQLAHAVRDAAGRAYNRTKHLPQRSEMMQAWADFLDELKRQARAGNLLVGSFGAPR